MASVTCAPGWESMAAAPLGGRLMSDAPDALLQKLKPFGQEHVLAWWPELSEDERRELTGQINNLNLAHLAELFAARDKTYALPSAEAIAPITAANFPEGESKAIAEGERALRQGEVAVLLVAGG